MCQSFFFNKVAGLKPATLLKKGPWHRCFPVNFAKFLRNTFFQPTENQEHIFSVNGISSIWQIFHTYHIC